MRSTRGFWAVALVVVVAASAAVYGVTRPAPRAPAPLALDGDGIEDPAVIHDRKGRPIISNVRTVEKGVLYRGSAFPTAFAGPGGQREYADGTAFEFLRARNVRHVVALLDDADAYYAEDGYLRYWSEQTGFRIDTTWVQIDPATPFSKNDRGGLRAAGILISLMRENVAGGGAVYIHDIEGAAHVAVAAAGYELWRNRGWADFDVTWPLIERRFRAGNTTSDVQSLRTIRDSLRFVSEL